jgi:hypothetical protein
MAEGSLATAENGETYRQAKSFISNAYKKREGLNETYNAVDSNNFTG